MTETITTGIFNKTENGAGYLRKPENSFMPDETDVFVPKEIVDKCQLVDGATVTGPFKEDEKKPTLISVSKICNLSIEKFIKRKPYNRLPAISPNKRCLLSTSGDKSMRVLDLITPIGKGTRGLIVSPPKSGKTTILQKIAQSICKKDPSVKIIILLIDERPEEVTWFRRSVNATVLASSSDQSVKDHTYLVELTMGYIQTELECGHDVVVLVDSLTRMGRAFNLTSKDRGRTLSGGVGIRALEIPRRFFGMARQIEGGGSVTILATALIETGSRMDQYIFEEFKGTGNSEIVLDRSLSEHRIFPAIDILSSSSRREERLYTQNEYEKIIKLRRALSSLTPSEAMNTVLNMIKKTKNNTQLINSIEKYLQ